MTFAGDATPAALPSPGAVRLPGWLAALIAALGGGLAGIGYAPASIWIAPPVAVGLLCLITRETRPRQAALLGFVFGLVMFGISISWEIVVAVWLPLALIPFMSLWTLGLALGLRLVQRLPAWPVWAASVWVLMEFCYSHVPFGGFGWDRLAFTTPDAPWGGFLGFIGAAGTSWVVALVGCLLAHVYLQIWHGGVKRIRQWGIGLGLAFAIALIGGGLRLVPVANAGVQKVSIGMVQGNVDGSAGRHTMGYARSVTNNHMSETIALMAQARAGIDSMPDFIVWPENSTDIDPTQDAETAKIIDAAQTISGVPILVGAVMEGPGPDERQTSALWWDGGQVLARYNKRNAVPFGEYTPLKNLVFALVPMAKMVGAQTVPGTTPGVLNGVLNEGRTIKVGDIICYELAFDSTVYDTVRYGGQVITVQSNNSSYTGTLQPKQQFQITRVRAMEMRREIVVATTSSFSGLIEADGKVAYKTQEATAAAKTFTVPLRTEVSLGVRVGPVFDGLACLVGLGAILAAGFAAIVSRHRRQG